jgi:DNA invertase Pin-like site-specific DNA recombinase
VEAVFSDLDVPGNVESRHGLNALIARCDAGDVGAVIIYNVSRLARDTHLFLKIVRELDTRGIQLLSTSESTEDRTIVTVLSAFAERERITLSNNIAYAVRESARRGDMILKPPYGYHRIDGTVIPDPRYAPVVHRIFTQYADGATLAEIVEGLERDGIPSPDGLPRWRTTSLTRMLANRAYAGQIAIAESRDPTGKIRPALITEGKHEPIIDAELWQRCARRKQSSTTVRHHPAYPTPWLAGHAQCAACGARLYLEVLRTKPERVQPYWILRCASSRRAVGTATENVCTGQRVAAYRPFDALARRALTDLLTRLVTPDEALAAARDRQGVARSDRGAWLRTQIADGESRLARAYEAYEHGDIALPVYRSRKQRLSDQVESARRELDTLPAPLELVTFTDAHRVLAEMTEATWPRSCRRPIPKKAAGRRSPSPWRLPRPGL